ncbi:MAG: glycosyltransferase family 4 protein [Ekhidna sp.]|nr:glycosyltransferase family 4 protein [Ekhidna sp.]
MANLIYQNETSQVQELQELEIIVAKPPKWFFLLKKTIKEKYDVLMISALDDPGKILNFIPSFLVAKCRKKKIVYDFLYWEWNKGKIKVHVLKRLRRNFIKILRGPLIRRMDRILTYGNNPMNYLLRCGIAEKIMIPTVDVSTMDDRLGHGENIRIEFDIPKEKLIVLYFGRIIPRKGLNYLIESFIKEGLQEKAVLLIAGSGKKKYLGYCKELAIGTSDILFAGHMKSSKRFQFFSQSDIFVLPCYPKENAVEPWGLSVNEALQAQTSVLTTDNAGVAGTVLSNGENSVVISSDNLSEELGKSLKLLIEDDALRKRIAANGRKTYEEKLRTAHKVQSFCEAMALAFGSR